MSRPKEIEDSVRISVVISKKQAEKIKSACLAMSMQEQRAIGVSEAIRMAISTAYPVPKDQQKKMF